MASLAVVVGVLGEVSMNTSFDTLCRQDVVTR